MGVHEWGVHLGGVAAGFAALVVIGRGLRGGWRVWRATRRRAKALHDLIEAELKPNGGSSMKDQLSKIDEKLTELTTKQAEVVNAIAFLQGWTDAHDAKHSTA